MIPMSQGNDERRMTYRRPELVNVGHVTEVTGAVGTPVRDNIHNDTPHYHNANPAMSEIDLID